MERQKSCQVCGRANAVRNFGAITCLPCAAFFRRTMTMALEFECICAKNPNKARLFGCKECRLKRCLEAGMKKEKIQAIQIRYILQQKQRQENQMRLLLSVKTTESAFDNEILLIGERVSLIWHSAVPLRAELFDSSLELLLHSRGNLLSRHEEFLVKSEQHQNFDKCAFLEEVAKNGVSACWLDCPARSLYVRGILILIGMLTALQPFGSLDVQDQMAQIRGTIQVAAHLVLPLESLRQSSEIMLVQRGFGQIEQWQAMHKFYGSDLLKQLPFDIFVKPMKEYADLNLEKLEATLLLYILLLTPTASNYSLLSKKAIGILHAECEKFGKQLLRFQQHRHGQQAGAQRYMESLQLVWGTVGRAQKYQQMVEYFESVLNKGGIEIEWPEIIKSLF